MIVKKAVLGSAAVSWPRGPQSPPEPVRLAQSGSDARQEIVQMDVIKEVVVPLEMKQVVEFIRHLPISGPDRQEVAAILVPEIDDIRARGHAEGLEIGRAEATTQVQEKMKGLLELLARICDEAQTAVNAEATLVRDSTISVIEEVIQKIAGPLLGSREAILGAVVQVVSQIAQPRELVIRVSQADLEVLESSRVELAAALGDRGLTLVADARVSTGGCLVESGKSVIDGRLELQLEELLQLIATEKQALRGVRQP